MHSWLNADFQAPFLLANLQSDYENQEFFHANWFSKVGTGDTLKIAV